MMGNETGLGQQLTAWSHTTRTWFPFTSWTEAIHVTDVNGLVQLANANGCDVIVGYQVATADPATFQAGMGRGSWVQLGTVSRTTNGRSAIGTIDLRSALSGHFWVRFGVGLLRDDTSDGFCSGTVHLEVQPKEVAKATNVQFRAASTMTESPTIVTRTTLPTPLNNIHHSSELHRRIFQTRVDTKVAAKMEYDLYPGPVNHAGDLDNECTFLQTPFRGCTASNECGTYRSSESCEPVCLESEFAIPFNVSPDQTIQFQWPVFGRPSPEFRRTAEEIIARAWFLLRASTDLIKWAFCVADRDEVVKEGLIASSASSVIALRLWARKVVGGRMRFSFENKSQPFMHSRGFSPLGGVISVPYSTDPVAPSPFFRKWVSIYEPTVPENAIFGVRAGAGTDSVKSTVIIEVATVIFHELFHTIGIDNERKGDHAPNRPNTRPCQSSYVVPGLLKWALVSRYRAELHPDGPSSLASRTQTCVSTTGNFGSLSDFGAWIGQ